LRAEARWWLEFPRGRSDAESIFVWKEYGYLISKTDKKRKATLYRWPLEKSNRLVTLEEVGELDVESPVTGADISPDGSRLGMVATDGGYVIAIDGVVEDAVGRKSFRVKSKKGQIEGCAFDRDGLLAIAESRELFLFEAREFVPANMAGEN